MTKKEFDGLTAAWFRDLVRDRAHDVDREFARLTGLSATEVNHAMNNKRRVTLGMIFKVTERLGIKTDDFFLDLVRRWREIEDDRKTGRRKPDPPTNGSHHHHSATVRSRRS